MQAVQEAVGDGGDEEAGDADEGDAGVEGVEGANSLPATLRTGVTGPIPVRIIAAFRTASSQVMHSVRR
jgi:hypothetical protein